MPLPKKHRGHVGPKSKSWGQLGQKANGKTEKATGPQSALGQMAFGKNRSKVRTGRKFQSKATELGKDGQRSQRHAKAWGTVQWGLKPNGPGEWEFAWGQMGQTVQGMGNWPVRQVPGPMTVHPLPDTVPRPKNDVPFPVPQAVLQVQPKSNAKWPKSGPPIRIPKQSNDLIRPHRNRVTGNELVPDFASPEK